MEQLIPDNLTYTDAGHLPIIKHFAKQINLVDTINTMVESQMQLQPGQAVLAMVLDTLSGRTPLYRLKEFFHEKDTELLLGTEIDPELFCDHNLGRVLDKIFDTGAKANFSKHMATHGLKPGAFVYIADSAFVTEDNIEKAGSGPTKFFSRLPATYKECSRAIQNAVNADDWIELGSLAETAPVQKRPAAVYRAHETTVNLYDRDYRAIVVHSSVHDKRRHKRIDRLLAKKRKDLDGLSKKMPSATYFCRADSVFKRSGNRQQYLFEKNHRIEVLGLVLLISLLIWLLMEHCMRRYITDTENTIAGWKDKPTTTPTSFMMTTKFLNILVLKVGHQRQLARPMNKVQMEYLKALNVEPSRFSLP